jgi:hypothetical protein
MPEAARHHGCFRASADRLSHAVGRCAIHVRARAGDDTVDRRALDRRARDAAPTERVP